MADEVPLARMTAAGVVLAGARVLPMAALLPFFGASFPVPLRFVLGFALAVAAFPMAVAPPVADGLFAALVLKEAAVGATLAVVASLPFLAAVSAGRLAETSSGLPGLATLYRWLAVAIFFSVGGHRLWLAAWGRSYEALPVGAFVSASSVAALVERMIRLTGDLFVVALGLCAPILVAAMLAEMVVGVAQRVWPELWISLAALPARAVAALCVLAGGSWLLARALGAVVRDSATATSGVLDLLR